MTEEEPKGFEYSPSPERLAKIEEAIERTEFSDNNTAFAIHLDPEEIHRGYYQDFLKEIEPNLAGETIVDLGCGDWMNTIDPVCRLAERTGAKKYIGVDKFNSPEKAEKLQISKQKEFPTLEIEMQSQDMLTFLAFQPDNSANIVINGIDAAIVHNKSQYEKAESFYRRLLEEEMVRVSGENHVIIVVYSPIISSNRLKEMGFEGREFGERRAEDPQQRAIQPILVFRKITQK